jgi:CRP-like cAMP-binding protein
LFDTRHKPRVGQKRIINPGTHIFIRISSRPRVGPFAHPDAALFACIGANLTSPTQHYKNRVLASLPEDEIARLRAHLSPLTLEQDRTLLDGNAKHGFFLEQGIASVVVTVENGDTVEVGVIGVDGVVGLPILFGTDGAPGRTFIQIAGSGFSINAGVLKTEFERPGELRRYLQKYMHAFLVQSAQTAACNRMHNIEERLARWLLTCRDRMETDDLHLTHEFLSHMLGAPRSTVTLAAGLLHRAGFIDHSRGVVTVRDRVGLEGAACECYRTVRDEYRRLSLL